MFSLAILYQCFRDVPLSLCPGTKNFFVLVSLFPRTKAGAHVPGQNHFPKRTKKQEMYIQKQEKDILKQERTFQNRKGHFKTGKDVLKQEIIEKNSDCPVPHPVKDFDRKVFIVPSRRILAACPGPSYGKILSLSVVSLSWDNEDTSVPLSRKVVLFHFFGNTILNPKKYTNQHF